MKLDPQRGVFWRHLGDFLQAGENDVANSVIHKSKSLKLLVREGNGGVLAQFKLEFAHYHQTRVVKEPR